MKDEQNISQRKETDIQVSSKSTLIGNIDHSSESKCRKHRHRCTNDDKYFFLTLSLIVHFFCLSICFFSLSLSLVFPLLLPMTMAPMKILFPLSRCQTLMIKNVNSLLFAKHVHWFDWRRVETNTNRDECESNAIVFPFFASILLSVCKWTMNACATVHRITSSSTSSSSIEGDHQQ